MDLYIQRYIYTFKNVPPLKSARKINDFTRRIRAVDEDIAERTSHDRSSRIARGIY